MDAYLKQLDADLWHINAYLWQMYAYLKQMDADLWHINAYL